MKNKLPILCIILVLLTGCAYMPQSAAVEADGVKIALIDTGISTKAIEKERILPGYNYVTGSDDTEDRINHGTAVSSIIVGCESAEVKAMSDNAYLIPLVVVDKVDGNTKVVTPDVLAKAIRDSIDIYEADIINVSLGIQNDDSALCEAVEYAAEKGIPVISAVGNGGVDGSPYYPAAYETVLAVGSCDDKGNESDFSQSGAEIFAPGERIMLASRNGVPYGIKGTSFATGFVSAYAANLLAEEPKLTPNELYDKLIEKALSNGGYLPLR
ncbi:MAG: S8 family serine peptidase [Lachnospiraceae bacterium]|nr:S8 family serine peptidase [Lachnospiraceae bacterium]